MHLIGITGLAGSGKDTAAHQIRKLLRDDGQQAALAALADPIKDMLLALGVPAPYMTERALKEQPVPGIGLSYRALAQTLGTEWGRALDADLWIRVAELRARHYVGEDGIIPTLIYTDIRFPNEAAWMRRHGGRLLRIVRPGVAPVRPHASEQHIQHMEVDVEIDNSASVDELRATLAHVLHRWGMLSAAGREEAAA
ncbi:hypothetical protein [Caldimonas sp.]|uniref:deoxynucleotide monophosphate kinase family protein n=1 Tax=Caldimonas sp. TaxID=2838790 RepID=UPI00307F454E